MFSLSRMLFGTNEQMTYYYKQQQDQKQYPLPKIIGINPLQLYLLQYLSNNIPFSMNKIAKKAVKYFDFQERPSDSKILQFCRKSHLYEQDIDTKKLIIMIRKGLLNSDKDVLRRLDFHFARETNKLLFDIYEIILQAPNGLTYKEIAAILNDEKTNNIAISHYCRKLYKTNFISLSYIKEGTMVTATKYKKKREESKDIGRQDLEDEEGKGKEQQLKMHLKDGFLIKELSLDINIMLNMTGMESLQKNGLTKEEINSNIFKTSEKKTISRIIENSKFQRDGQRKGRIYGFRFKGDLSKIKKFVGKSIKLPSKTAIVSLKAEVEEYLNQQFPDINTPNLLQHLINTSNRESSSKQSRQCDPIKLSRFIYVLNFIDHKPCTIHQMLNYIIEQDKINQPINIGTMHKKSLCVILNTLINLKLVKLQDDIIYPTWKEHPKLIKDTRRKPREQIEPRQLRKRKQKETVPCIVLTAKQAHQRLTTEQIFFNINSSWFNTLSYAFRSIQKVAFKREEPQVPRLHALRILDEPSHKVKSLNNPISLQDLFEQIDHQLKGMLFEEDLKFLDQDVKKYLRMYPSRKVSEFVKRFGRSSYDKIFELVSRKIIRVQGHGVDEVYTVDTENYYMI